MAAILVVEGNTPEVVARTLEAGGIAAAENYAAVLAALAQRIGARIKTRILRPSFPEFSMSEFARDAVVFEGVAGVVFTGSGVRWSADAPEAAAHRAVVERVFAAGIPAIGSCYGLQLAATVLGGRVRWNPRGTELPIAREIRLTEAGRAHPLHDGRPAVFDCPCIHRDEVADLPAGAVLTATNAHSVVQAMVYEQGSVRFWGMQYHPEMALADVARCMLRGRGAVMEGSAAIEPDPAVDAYIAVSDAPAANAALMQRHSIAPEVVDFTARTAELDNWLRMVLTEAAVADRAADRAAE